MSQTEGDAMKSGILENARIGLSLVGIAVVLVALFFSGCAAQSDSQTEEEYADARFVEAMSDSLEKRMDNETGFGYPSTEEAKTLTAMELDALMPFRDMRFESPKLQEAAIAYINLLDEMKEAAALLGVQSSDGSTEKQWRELSNERTKQLMNFAENFGLTVDEAHSEKFDTLVKQGSQVAKEAAESEAVNALVDAMVFEKSDDGYGFYTYTCIAENTTDYSLAHVSLTLSLYDADGVKANQAYASTNEWIKGEKVKFEAISNVDAAEVKVSIDGYSIV